MTQMRITLSNNVNLLWKTFIFYIFSQPDEIYNGFKKRVKWHSAAMHKL